MYCQKCGAEVTAAFCAKCGAPAAGGPGPQTSSPPPAAGLTENAAGALCYLLGLLTGVIFLVLEPHSRNPRIRFHAWQSILLNIALIAFFIAESILFSILPGVLFFLIVPVQGLISLCLFGGWLFLMWKTYQGETIVLPAIGPIAQKQAGL